MMLRSKNKKIHFVGIGGIGMSGLADILLEEGFRVSGSDRQKSAITDYLETRGAEIMEGHSTDNVADSDLLVYTSAIAKDNPEFLQARKNRIPVIRRAEMLGQLMNRKFGIGVAGTHGKTTVSSMLGEVLVDAELDPTLVIGGRLKRSMTNARLGKGEILLAEADEYDRSFLALNPRMAVITSIESDHLDIYKDMDDILHTFLSFANRLPFDGVVMVNGDDANIQKIIADIQCDVLTFGLSDGVYIKGKNLKFKNEVSDFDVEIDGKTVCNIKLKTPGEHNIKNALAAFSVARELGVPIGNIVKSLEKFSGVERRFDIIGEVNGILIVDDYAHHPTEIAETLKSARNGWRRRLVAVFQPHLYSRTRDFYQEFAEALGLADLVIVAGIYPAREEPIPGVSGEMIHDVLLKKGKNSRYISDKTNLLKELLKTAQPGDLVITMGAGDINFTGLALRDQLTKEAK